MRRTGIAMRGSRFVAAAMLAAVLMGAGCGGAGQQDPRESLPDSVRDYHAHLIWERYDEAAGYLPVEQRNVFIGQFEEMGDEVRFTEYETGVVDLNAETQEATILVTLRWYEEPYYVVRETQVRETWRFDEESEYWWLVSRSDPEEPLPEAAPLARE